jgi:hypothetical protein
MSFSGRRLRAPWYISVALMGSNGLEAWAEQRQDAVASLIELTFGGRALARSAQRQRALCGRGRGSWIACFEFVLSSDAAPLRRR